MTETNESNNLNDKQLDDQEIDNKDVDNKDNIQIPKKRLDKEISKYKTAEASRLELKKKLEAYETAEKEKSDLKLLEEKKFDELLKNKDDEILKIKSESESLKQNIALEKVNSKVINLANKEGAVDAEDILRFVSVNDLLEMDAEVQKAEIEKRVAEIKESKGHLFQVSIRDKKENGSPYQVNGSPKQSEKNTTLDSRIEASLRRSHKK